MRWRLSLAIVTTAAMVELADPSAEADAIPLASAPFAFTWGGDGDGDLGDGLPIANQSAPVAVLEATGSCCLGQMVDIQGADTHSLALDDALRVWTWGSNYVGQLGIGNLAVADSPIPMQVPNLSGRIPAAPVQETIAAEGGHNLVIDGNGTVWSWGANDNGQLGIGSPGAPTCGGPPPSLYVCSPSPVQVSLVGVVGVGAGARHSLAIVGDCSSGPGDAYAWGANGAGQLGDGSVFDRFTPVPVHGPLNSGFLTGVAKMVGGAGHTLALMCNGELLAWGANNAGQLASGNNTSNPIPAPVVVPCANPPRPLLGCPLLNVVDIAAGFEHSLAVDVNGDVWFWGDNTFGQLCNGATTDLTFATKVLSGALTTPSAGFPLDVVAGGAGFSLVLLAAQHSLVACGLNGVGQLGDCSTTGSGTPVPVGVGPTCSGLFTGVEVVEAGENHGLMIAQHQPPATSTATPTPTTVPVRTPTASATVTRTETRTPSPSATVTRTATHSPTATPTCEPVISVVVSTGRNAVPIGNPDQIWSLIAAPPGVNFSPPGPATVIAANGGWTTLPNTQWISANTGCTATFPPSGCPPGLYQYELCWEQCGDLVDAPQFEILADNRASTFLDGTLVAATASPGFTTPTSFGFNPLPGPGIHSLRVDVTNDPFGSSDTATGMDFSGILNGSVKLVPCQATPPTATASSTPTSTLTPTATPTPTGCVRPPSGMVVWLSADNTTADLSGNGNHGTLQGAASYATGEVNLAFAFPSFADFVEIANAPSLNFAATFSIDAWINTVNNTTASIVDKRTGTAANPVGYHLFLFGGKLGFQLGDGSPFSNALAPGPTINDGNWHHVAATIDRGLSTGGSLYVDGTLVATFDPTVFAGPIANTANLRIGQRYLSPAQAFAGAIDELEIFDRVLGAQEIHDLWAAAASGKCKPPLPTPSNTPRPVPPCIGDCDGDGEVTVEEVVTGVNKALGVAGPDVCPQFDPDSGGIVTIDAIIAAVNNALSGCPT